MHPLMNATLTDNVADPGTAKGSCLHGHLMQKGLVQAGKGVGLELAGCLGLLQGGTPALLEQHPMLAGLVFTRSSC